DMVGGYDVQFLVSDGVSTSQQSLHVAVANVAPTVDPQSNAMITVGKNFTRKLSFIDPGKDVWTVRAHFGQGFVSFPVDAVKKTFVLENVFTAQGPYLVPAQLSSNRRESDPRQARAARLFIHR
ncbi:MAG: hypothetical protein ABL921_34130, partial [Pirellula sp.]